MLKLDPKKPIRKKSHFIKKSTSNQKWSNIIGLFMISVLFLLSFLFLPVSLVYAHAAGTDTNLSTGDPVQFGLQSDSAQTNSRVNTSIPAQQVATTTLEVEIISSPWATVDSNGVPGTSDGSIPEVFVVEAVITNTGDTTAATGVVVELDYNPGNGWILLAGEDPVRTYDDDLAPGAAYHVYWMARYPQDLPPAGNASHQYTVSAYADNADVVATSENFYEPNPDWTVQTRESESTSNQALTYTRAEVVVGVTFTVTVGFDLGNNPDDTVFSPVGNSDFEPSAYRLLATEVRFFDDAGTQESIVPNRLYFPTLPSFAENAEVTYIFLALTPENTRLCPYAGINFGPNAKYDQKYCSTSLNMNVPITGTLSLALAKQASSSTIKQGQLLNYTISYTNTGDKELQYAWIWDDIPTDVASIETGTVTPSPTVMTDGRIGWQLGEIPPAGQPDSSGTFTFTLHVDGNGSDLADGTPVVNNAFFSIIPSTNFPENPNPALTDTVTTTVQVPIIEFIKSDGQETAGPGDYLTYTLQLTNTGSTAATSLVITDVLPDNVTLAGSTTPGFDNQDGQTLVWNTLEEISPEGGTLTITVPVRIDPNLSEQTILTNTGTAIYENVASHVFSSKTATDTTSVQIPPTSLDFSKTAEDVNGSPLAVGDTIRYTLQVTNTGDNTAYNVTVTDDLPDQITCQSVSGDNTPTGCADPLVWNVGNLAAEKTVTLIIDVTVNPGTEGQSIINTASVTGGNVPNPPPDPEVCPDGSQPIGDLCWTTPGPNTSLSLSKTAEDVNGSPLAVGDTIRYTLQVTNTGDNTAYNVTVTDDLPDQVTCQSVSGDNAPTGCADPLIWNIGNLATDEMVTLIIDVTVNPGTEGQSIINTASVTGGNVPNPPPNPEICPDGSQPDAGTCPTTPAPLTTTLAFKKTAVDIDGLPLVISDTIRYTLLVTNTGSYTAYNVVVTDDLPAQVTCQSVSGSAGNIPLCEDDPLVWAIPALAPDDSASLEIEVIINSGSEGQSIINSATVTANNVTEPPSSQVCPDGSVPEGDVCENTPGTPPLAPTDYKIFLPILLR